MTDAVASDGDERLTLHEAAAALGVHYMTVYRYVRNGRLDAQRSGNQWSVTRSALAALRPADAPGRKQPGAEPRRDYAGELATLLVAGDEPQAWRLVQDALSSAFAVEPLYFGVIGPAMRAVGDAWEAGTISVADEHRASVIAQRIVGRLGPLFVHRGPTRGRIVLGTPAGDRHALATALIADPLRGRRFAVTDLGADTPAGSFAEVVASGDRPRAVGIAASIAVGDDVVAATVDLIHAAAPVPVILGGRAILSVDHATALGADAYSASAADAIAWFETVGG
jgi:excisionase family DNA binding protein